MGQPYSHPPFRGRPKARAGGNQQGTRQNQYRPHANTIAKTEHNNRAMRKASDIGSSDSFSGSVGKLAPGSRIKRGRVLEVDAATGGDPCVFGSLPGPLILESCCTEQCEALRFRYDHRIRLLYPPGEYGGSNRD